ncbi:MAG: AzlC family ABC transporter permease [Rhodospirillales bacterium]|nr:MAG: AzlC family ABC transporter permease [Rhodospirillales bacterium]
MEAGDRDPMEVSGRPWRGEAAAALRAVAPAVASMVPFALLIGFLARQNGLSTLEALLMSAMVFAGSAQFVALDLWSWPVPVASLALTTFIINARHILMGAAVMPHIAHWRTGRAYPALFFLADEIWALSMARAGAGRLRLSYYAALVVPFYLTWVSMTTLGHLAGAAIRDPARFGFDFAFTAIFLVILAALWRGRRTMGPWVASAAAAVAVWYLVAGPWYILAGGAAGAAVGALQGVRDDGG